LIFNIFIGGAELIRVIGIDLDGPIWPVVFYNPSIRLPWPLFFLLAPIVLFAKPDAQVVKKMRAMEEQGCIFIIVSATPNQFLWFRKLLLKIHRVPFESLYCIGGGKGTKERKLKVIQEKNIEVFVDDDSRVLKFLQSNSVKAVRSFHSLN